MAEMPVGGAMASMEGSSEFLVVVLFFLSGIEPQWIVEIKRKKIFAMGKALRKQRSLEDDAEG